MQTFSLLFSKGCGCLKNRCHQESKGKRTENSAQQTTAQPLRPVSPTVASSSSPLFHKPVFALPFLKHQLCCEKTHTLGLSLSKKSLTS